MKIVVEHEVPYDKGVENRCIYGGGDFWGHTVCGYYVRRNRTHGYKAPVERNLPKCALFNEWLNGDNKCEKCIWKCSGGDGE